MYLVCLSRSAIWQARRKSVHSMQSSSSLRRLSTISDPRPLHALQGAKETQIYRFGSLKKKHDFGSSGYHLSIRASLCIRIKHPVHSGKNSRSVYTLIHQPTVFGADSWNFQKSLRPRQSGLNQNVMVGALSIERNLHLAGPPLLFHSPARSSPIHHPFNLPLPTSISPFSSPQPC